MKAAQAALQQNTGDGHGSGAPLFARSGAEDLRGLEWRYLWQEGQGDEVQTFAHPSMVYTAILAGMDGK